MRSKPAVPPASPPDARDTPSESERDQISQNIEAVLEFYAREEQKISRSQRILERISHFFGQPAFLGFILLFVALWMLANAVMRQFGMAEFDPAPFFWLQGIVGLGALLTATVVLDQAEPARQARGTAGASGPESDAIDRAEGRQAYRPAGRVEARFA